MMIYCENMYDVSPWICLDMSMLFVRSWKEQGKSKLRYSLICFTQDDCVMLISQTNGLNEMKFPSNTKELMIMLYNELSPMTYDKRQIKVYLRKGLKLNTDELDMRSVPSLLGR